MADDRPSSPPTRASLKAWWKQFNLGRSANKKSDDKDEVHAGLVFGRPLKESLRYASVQISTANADGQMYVWGYIPVVVAKCGLYLKEKSTEVEGTFRINGSNKRMRDLQAIFEAPPRYGKNIDWKAEVYTSHDVASVFRRFLTMLPDPVIISSLYHEFRNVYQKKTKADDIIQEYKRLIRSMPRANQYLLLYVLDLLSVFARKCEKNLMTASNLAVIFRPGILSHPDHDMTPGENELSTRVLEFLIDHQDWFMLDIPPPPKSGTMDSQNSIEPAANIKGGSGTSGATTDGEDDQDLHIVPSSEDEHSRKPTTPAEEEEEKGVSVGGWKLISRRTKTKRGRDKDKEGGKREMARSKSNVDHRRVPSPRSTAPGELSPVHENSADDVVLGTGNATVGRSRTLPSKSPVATEEGTTKANVLVKKGKKTRPVSVQAPKERDKKLTG